MDGFDLLRRSVGKLRKSGKFEMVLAVLQEGFDRNLSRFNSITKKSPNTEYIDLFNELINIGSVRMTTEFENFTNGNPFLWGMLITHDEENLIKDLIGLIRLWEKEME